MLAGGGLRAPLAAMTLLERHVELFNQGVRSGDFAPMLEQFTEDAELVFEGVPAGPFHGKETIAAAYAANPPDDEVDVLSSRGCRRRDDRRALRLARGQRSRGRADDPHERAASEIARLVVTFD